jgi:AraC-like DNA-binding protein
MLLKENLENADFKLTDALKKYGYNPDYLRRSFKKHTSLSPLSYLNSLRIEKAKELLVFEHFLSVDQVAARCGFNDSFYFSTAFKRHVGESPLKYKKKHEQGK